MIRNPEQQSMAQEEKDTLSYYKVNMLHYEPASEEPSLDEELIMGDL